MSYHDHMGDEHARIDALFPPDVVANVWAMRSEDARQRSVAATTTKDES